MLNISLEEIVSIVVKEVVAELNRKGIKADSAINNFTKSNIIISNSKKEKTEVELDIRGFKTPIVTEENILNLEGSITTVIVPMGTVITPNARDLIRKRELTIKTKNKE